MAYKSALPPITPKKKLFFSQSVHSFLFLKAVDAKCGFGIAEPADLRPFPLAGLFSVFKAVFPFFSLSWLRVEKTRLPEPVMMEAAVGCFFFFFSGSVVALSERTRRGVRTRDTRERESDVLR